MVTEITARLNELWNIIDGLGKMFPFDEKKGVIARLLAEYATAEEKDKIRLKAELETILVLIKRNFLDMRKYSADVYEEYEGIVYQLRQKGKTKEIIQKSLGKIADVEDYEKDNYEKLIDDSVAIVENAINNAESGKMHLVQRALGSIRARTIPLRWMIARLRHPELLEKEK